MPEYLNLYYECMNLFALNFVLALKLQKQINSELAI